MFSEWDVYAIGCTDEPSDDYATEFSDAYFDDGARELSDVCSDMRSDLYNVESDQYAHEFLDE